MNLKEMIDDFSKEKFKEEWGLQYENLYEQECDKYPVEPILEYIDLLKKVEPTPSEYSIVLEMIKEPWDDEEYVCVNGRKNDDPQSWAMELSTNSEWLGFEIDCDLDISKEEMICHIIWEMTFFGFTDESRKEINDELDKRHKEIDYAIANGTIDDITVPLEEI